MAELMATQAHGNPMRGSRIAFNLALATLCALAFVLVVAPLADILWLVFERGSRAMSWTLSTQVTNGISGGLQNAIEGTLVLSCGAILFAAPVGVAAGIYLAGYGISNWGRSVRFLCDVLVGVPSIVLGYFRKRRHQHPDEVLQDGQAPFLWLDRHPTLPGDGSGVLSSSCRCGLSRALPERQSAFALSISTGARSQRFTQ